MKYKERCKELERQNDLLKKSVKQFQWMARRYCDGRSSYVTSMFNDLTRELLNMGVELDLVDGTYWAKDRLGRAFDGLSEEEAYMEITEYSLNEKK